MNRYMGVRSAKCSLLFAAAAVLQSSCIVSAIDVQSAVRRIGAEWEAENAIILAKHGSHTVESDPAVAFSAVVNTFEILRFSVVEQDSVGGALRVERMLSDSDIDERMRKAEERRLKRIFTEEVGIAGRFAHLTAEGYVLILMVQVEANAARARITIEEVRTIDTKAAEKPYLDTDQIPPSALRSVLAQIWHTLDRQLIQ